MAAGIEAIGSASLNPRDPFVAAAHVARLFASESGNQDATQRLLELVVEQFSDWGTIHLLDSAGRLRRAAAHHRDPAMSSSVERLRLARPLDLESTPDMARPMATRRATVHRRSHDELRAMAPSPEVFEIWARLGFASGVLLPLVAGDRTVGVMALMSARVEAFSPDEVAALERLAAECALVAETDRLVREADAEQGEQRRLRATLDAFLAHAPFASVVVDPDMRIVHHNDALHGVFDATAPTSRSSPVQLADLDPALARPISGLLERVFDEGSADPIEIRTGEPGRRRFWQVTGFPIKWADDALLGAGLVFVEVTDERLVARRQRESLARLDLSLEAGGMGTWDWDLITGSVRWSNGMESLAGLGAGEFEGTARAVMGAIAASDRSRAEAALVAAARSGDDYADELRIQRPNGDQRWIEARGRVVATRDGLPLRMIGVATDVTDRHAMEEVKLRLLEREHAARVAAEASRARLAILADVSGALATTLDPQAVYETLAAMLVPKLADWCVLDALDDDGSLRETAVVHIDPRQIDDIREMRRRRRDAGGDGIWSVRRAMRTGRSERVEDITDADLQQVSVDDDHFDLLRRLSPRSAVVAPLVSRGRVLGGITLVVSDRSFDAEDQWLVEGIANRAATAVDTAMLFDSRTAVAKALQQTLLPPALPEIPGVDLWADYRVGEVGIEIGGDFYDVFESTSGWNVVLGDVCGKGPEAAALTGLFRHTLRAVDAAPGPAAALGATNDAILDQIDDSRFVTAVLAGLKPSPGGLEVAVASGGHPRPVLVRANGTVERVEVEGTLLGVLPDPPLEEVTVRLAPGDSLVLYTDGVTEARNGPEQFGERRLLEAMARGGPMGSAQDVTRRVLDAVDDFRSGGFPLDADVGNDDIAVVAIRVPRP